EVLASAYRELDAASVDRDLRIVTVQTLVDEVMIAAGARGRPLLTVVGIPAPVDVDGASPVDVGTFWRLMNSDFPDHLEGTVIVDDDANLTALADHTAHPNVNLLTLLARRVI